jgi:GT2 family glycosyltransferase
VVVRREALERLSGWDEGFFLYSEDRDLCRRLRSVGYDIRYEPEACAIHLGGRSAPRAGLLPTLAASRIRYAYKHQGGTAALLERIGIGLGSLTHAALTTKGGAARRGYLGAFGVACRPQRAASGPSARGESLPTNIETEAVND